jgi:hypothetical protein
VSLHANVDAVRELQYKADNLEQGYKRYFWRVRSAGAGGVSAYSSSNVFTTAIAPPAQVFPQAGAQGQPRELTLVWSAVFGAKAYRLQLSTSFAFASPSVDTVISDTAFVVQSLLESKRYYWRVQAMDSDGPGVFASRNFTTAGSTSVLNEIPEHSLEVYPLPANDRVHIRLQHAPAELGEESFRCLIVDLQGRTCAVLKPTRTVEGGLEWQWLSAGVSAGMYKAVVQTARGNCSASVVIQR